MEGRRRYFGFEGVNPKQEQEFHASRWERKAAELNAHMQKIGNPDGLVFTAGDLMYEEASKDNKQYEKWLSPEYQESDKHLQEVIADWRAVRDDSPDKPKEFRMVQVMLGAGEQSAQGAAQLLALQHMGYTKHTHAYVGSSGASGPIIYAAEGRAEVPCSIFMNEALTPEFLDTTGLKPKLDTRVIAASMRKGPKAINVPAFKAAAAKVIALITNTRTKKVEMKDMQQMDDPIDACEASSAIPAFRKPVELDGKKYMDGAFGDVPLKDIIRELKPTHMLIHPNKAFDFIRQFENRHSEKLALGITSALGSLSNTIYSAEQLLRMKERVGEVLKKIGQDMGGVKIAVLWPPDEDLDVLTTDPDIMRRAVLESYRKTVSDFGEKQPEVVELMPGDMLPVRVS